MTRRPDFDKYDRKPRWLPEEQKAILRSFWMPMFESLEAAADEVLDGLILASGNVSPINCAWQDFETAKLLFDSAIAVRDSRLKREAPRREARLGPQGESGGAVRQSPEPYRPSPREEHT